MFEAIERVARDSPQSRWAEEALFAAGNYYYAAIDRERAAQAYRRFLEQFPRSSSAVTAHWRALWTDYLARRSGVAAQFEEHLRRFSGSPNTPNALYWLGRIAEREGNVPLARGFYLKLTSRFPETYFGRLAGERMLVVGAGPTNSSDILNLIPEAPAPPAWNGAVPGPATDHWNRAMALRSIALDDSAELELRAGHAATGAPQLLLEAARSALDAGRVFAAITTARLAFPQLEARRLEEGPAQVWRLAYPLVYEEAIERAAQAQKLDPMLVAGLIRQESTFQPAAVSRAGAMGLMQVLPRTGRLLARRLRVRSSASPSHWPMRRRRRSSPRAPSTTGRAWCATWRGRQRSGRSRWAPWRPSRRAKPRKA